MEIPPSLIQASIPSTFLAPTLKSRILVTTIASTITSDTIQTIPLYVSTLIGSIIQANTLYSSTITSNNISINTLSTSFLIGSIFQTDVLTGSSLIGNIVHTNNLYGSSLVGSTIQTNIVATSTLLTGTIQINTLLASSVIGSTIQANTLRISTLSGSTIKANTLKASMILGSSIQTNTIRVGIITGSTFQTNQINTNIAIGSTLFTNIFQSEILQFSTLLGSTIQANTANISTLLLQGSTFQTNNFIFNTISGNTIQVYEINPNTLFGSSIICSTIQMNTVNCSTMIGNIIQCNHIILSTLSGSSIQTTRLTVSTIQCSTLQGNTVQTIQINGTTLFNSTIQTSTLAVSSIIGSTIQTNTLQVSTLSGSTIETNILQVSTLSTSTIQTNILQVSTLSGSTIQTKQLNLSTLLCNIIQSFLLNGSTIIGSTIQTSTLVANAIKNSTIIGSTIQTDTLEVSSMTCSTIIGEFLDTNRILITDGNKALSTSAINISQLPYLTNVISQVGGIGQTNTWAATQTFSVSPILNGLSTTSPSFLLGTNASNQLVQFAQVGMQGSVLTNYIPYASGPTMHSTSIMYRVNGSDIIIGQIPTVMGEWLTFDLGTGGNYHNLFRISYAGVTTPNSIHFLGSDDNITWISLGISTSPNPFTYDQDYNYTLSNKRYIRLVILNIYNIDGGRTGNSIVLANVSISYNGGTNLFVNVNQVSVSPNLIIDTTRNWTEWYLEIFSVLYTRNGYRTIGIYTGSEFTNHTITDSFPTPYIFSIAGLTQATNVIANIGTFSKIDTPDKRSGLNGLQIPNRKGCNFYMGTMNNNGTGSYTDTLYLNSSSSSFDMSDSFNVQNNIVVASTGTGFVTMPSFTPSATGLTFSALIILTGSTMPGQWARIFDMGNLSETPTRNFDIAFNSNGTLHFEYRASDNTLTTIDTTIRLVLNTMYHIVWSIDTSGYHGMYINGVEAGIMIKAISSDTYPYFYLGKSNWSVDPYPNMTIYDFRMMNRSLSMTDVQALYASIKTVNQTILSGQYIILNRSNGEYLNLSEIRVFSYPGGPNIITPSTSVSFPDVRSDFPVSNFVDGNLNTMMHSTGTTNSTVTINLGAMFPIYKIIIYNRITNCWNRANSIVLTIQNSSNTTVYTASPIPDKLGRTTIQTDTGNITDYYYTFTYFPPYAAVIGDFEKIADPYKVNVVMFNKGAPGMRIYQGIDDYPINYTVYRDLLLVSDVNSVDLSLGQDSDTNGITFGPSATTPCYLKVAAGPNRVGTNVSQIISTNGNLHLDCASNAKTLYLNKSVSSSDSVIFSYTPWTHTGNLTVTGNITVRWGITTPDWYYISSDKGMLWTTYDRGFCSPEQAGTSFGTVNTYNTGRGGWSGWGVGSKACMMTGVEAPNIANLQHYNYIKTGIHDNVNGWVIWYNDDKYVKDSANLKWGNASTWLGGGSARVSQGKQHVITGNTYETVYFAVYFNGSDDAGGMFYVKGAGVYGKTSDERIKKNIKSIDIEQSIAFIRGIIPSYFCLKQEPFPQLDASGKETGQMYGVCNCEQSGFIAQNVLDSAKKAGLPQSTVSNSYEYEQELSLPEEERKTLLGLGTVPLLSHSYNALKGTMAKQDNQQTQIDEIDAKCSMLDTGLTSLQEIVRQNAELLQLLTKT